MGKGWSFLDDHVLDHLQRPRVPNKRVVRVIKPLIFKRVILPLSLLLLEFCLHKLAEVFRLLEALVLQKGVDLAFLQGFLLDLLVVSVYQHFIKAFFHLAGEMVLDYEVVG